MKILTVIGARPQFIKSAIFSKKIREHTNISEIIVHTGQHYDENMSSNFFLELGMSDPDYSLMVGSGNHGEQTGKMMLSLERVMQNEIPDFVLVYGDTNSTLAGALVAAKLLLPVVHVEAGLRSFDRAMPEEINRIVTDHLSEYLFSPTNVSVQNLLNEGICAKKINLVGDVMYDAALYYADKIKPSVKKSLSDLLPELYILATVHRAENTDNVQNLKAIIGALFIVAKKYHVVFPMHPRTRRVLIENGLFDDVKKKLIVLPPQGYMEMLYLEKNSHLIATDSGGVQKEAFFFRKPCVTLRKETEWTELTHLGWNKTIKELNSQSIASDILSAFVPSESMNIQPFGNGNAADLIIDSLLR